MKIVGAGLAGLLAGHLFPRAHVHERSKSIRKHHALLRFRSPQIGEVTGIPFKRVMVRKNVEWNGELRSKTTIEMANHYSQKVIGYLQDRSVWDLAPVERWIAPHDFQQRLLDGIESRVHMNSPVDFTDTDGGPIISTAPMSAMHRTFGLPMEMGKIDFHSESIHVVGLELPGADVYQTIYFPSLTTSVYRASITGDRMAIESMKPISHEEVERTLDSFGLTSSSLLPTTAWLNHETKFGKLLPINEAVRRRFIRTLTTERQIYSLGRFATWRNILLDDVFKDIQVIKRLVTADQYDRSIMQVKQGELF